MPDKIQPQSSSNQLQHVLISFSRYHSLFRAGDGFIKVDDLILQMLGHVWVNTAPLQAQLE